MGSLQIVPFPRLSDFPPSMKTPHHSLIVTRNLDASNPALEGFTTLRKRNFVVTTPLLKWNYDSGRCFTSP
ncbi:hypothetical protein EON65_49115 [archaeon]|nr:MAG: hypothetical protein EON65_49115 [archaeon]